MVVIVKAFSSCAASGVAFLGINKIGPLTVHAVSYAKGVNGLADDRSSIEFLVEVGD